ncbi:DNA methyltransferase [Gordonia phage Rabbitrun]|uniref:DNA methylase n=1 Tax=Gordonia phage Rabbitrun TaxID=2762280 RepID=A0A7G8LIN9_9CAUD|nr:DNA methyltransferase [Gordonia phage Rabbitrun]QNJ57111.1 DNA methylase [Gordonia phage Rabbitrun]
MSNGFTNSHNPSKGGGQRETRWLTPREIVEPLGEFDLDPAGAPGHQLAAFTFMPENGLDGLEEDWLRFRVWLNPPYGKELVPFMRKMAEHNYGTALVFARTETEWFRNYVWGAATALLFLSNRLHFLEPDGTRAKHNAGAPSVLVAYGAEDAQMLAESGLDGFYVRIRE